MKVPYAAILGAVVNGQKERITREEAAACLAVIEHLRDSLSKTDWVPVSQRLPESNQLVIVEGGVARLNKSLQWISETSGGAGRPIQWTVTHWMPLPEAPK